MADNQLSVVGEAENTPSLLWKVENKPVAIRIDTDVVVRILEEALRGFGAVPKRGMELGGILLGSAEPVQSGWLVHIVDFEPVSCRHARGPGYLLTVEERAEFDRTRSRWQESEGRRMYAVGYYRSHTRQDLELSAEDRELLDSQFTAPYSIALLVKPYATRPSVGAFFIRESGTLQSGPSYLEFPFRRPELSEAKGKAELPAAADILSKCPQEGTGPARQGGNGCDPARARPALGGQATEFTGVSSGMASAPPTLNESAGRPPVVSDQLVFGLPTAKTDEKTGRKLKTGWVWIPLSFFFLLLGVVLGLQVALSVRSQIPATPGQDPYALNLSVAVAGDSLHVRWDRNAAAIQHATRGTLRIRDGAAEKNVELDIGQLQNGSVIYRRAGSNVHFRLEVQVKDKANLAESIEYRAQPKP